MTRLDPKHHDWMAAPQTRKLMEALRKGGAQPRYVGGAVRNALLEKPVADVDIATPLTPDKVQKLLAEAAIKTVPTGIEHGTLTAVVDGRPFEVTTLRRDVSTDGRRAVVAFTEDWAEDARRRDFTMNALYASAEGEVLDFVGGVEDLQAGRVRFVGDATARIREDYLRILRLFRFHAWYGKGEMDADALRAAAEGEAGLAQLSGERIAKELLRLLECPNPAPVLRTMAASGILPELLPFALQLPRLERLIQADAENAFPADGLLRLAALLPDDIAAARAVAGRLRLSGADQGRLEALAAAAEKMPAHLSAQDVRKLLYRLGAGAFKDRVRLSWAAASPGTNAIPWRMLLSVADAYEKPRFALTGHDVMQAGVPEGPEVGKILAQLEDWWIEQDFPDDDAALAGQLKALTGPQ